MKNYVNHLSESNIQDYDLEGVPLAEISEFAIFEVLLALISLLIVSTSSLVIYRLNQNMLGLILFLSLLVFLTSEWDSSVHQYRALCAIIYDVRRKCRLSCLFLAIFSIFFRTHFLAYSQQLLQQTDFL